MNSLALHIEYLLQHHDCVILPGLGAFLAQDKDAVADFEKGILTPPMRIISWKDGIRKDDGLLAYSYARRLGVTLQEGRDRLYKDLDTLSKQIEDEGECIIGKIGALSLSSHTYHFQPRLSSMENAELMGMCEIKLDSFKGIIKETPTSTLKAPRKPITIVHPETGHPGNPVRSTFKTYWPWVAAMVLAILTTSGFWLGNNHTKPAATQPRMQTASVMPVKIDNYDLNPTESSESNNLEELIPEEALPGNHYLIVGTFRKLDEAKNFVAMHQDSDLKIIGNKLFRVSVACSENPDELRQLMRTSDIVQTYSQPWIYSLK